MRLRICGGFAVLGWGFSGALSGQRRQRGAGPGPWRGGRLHGVFKPVYGGSVVGGRAGGSCQCFSQQMPPAKSSFESGQVDSRRGVSAIPQKKSAGDHYGPLRSVFRGF